MVDIVVRGRGIEVSERFRARVEDKLAKVERLDHKVQRVDVEVSKEANPRLAERAFKVELTIRSRGPVVRAEAAAEEKYAALDAACGKLELRLFGVSPTVVTTTMPCPRYPGRRPRRPARPSGRGRRPVGRAGPHAADGPGEAPRREAHDARRRPRGDGLVGHDFSVRRPRQRPPVSGLSPQPGL